MKFTNDLALVINNNEYALDDSLSHEGIVRIAFISRSDSEWTTEEQWNDFTDGVDDIGTEFLAKWLSQYVIKASTRGRLHFIFENPINIVTGFTFSDGIRESTIYQTSELKITLRHNWIWKHGEATASMLDVYGKITK